MQIKNVQNKNRLIFFVSCTSLVNDNNKCFQLFVVYQLICLKCKGTYIGFTIQNLHNRIKQHKDDAKSALSIHIQSCNNNWRIKTSIIRKKCDTANTRIAEGLKQQRINAKRNLIDMAAYNFLYTKTN